MAEITRMRNFKMLLTSVSVKIEQNIVRTIIGQFLKCNIKIGPKKIQNGGNYEHAQLLNAYNFCLSSNLAKLIRTIIGQFLKCNIKIAPKKTQNGRN